jgi:hypothetical protein
MVTWDGDADNDAFGTNELREKADYDTSSGESFWVQQYLEWCESKGGEWPRGVALRTSSSSHAFTR